MLIQKQQEQLLFLFHNGGNPSPSHKLWLQQQQQDTTRNRGAYLSLRCVWWTQHPPLWRLQWSGTAHFACLLKLFKHNMHVMQSERGKKNTGILLHHKAQCTSQELCPYENIVRTRLSFTSGLIFAIISYWPLHFNLNLWLTNFDELRFSYFLHLV